jgi:hypothetical protein
MSGIPKEVPNKIIVLRTRRCAAISPHLMCSYYGVWKDRTLHLGVFSGGLSTFDNDYFIPAWGISLLKNCREEPTRLGDDGNIAPILPGIYESVLSLEATKVRVLTELQDILSRMENAVNIRKNDKAMELDVSLVIEALYAVRGAYVNLLRPPAENRAEDREGSEE